MNDLIQITRSTINGAEINCVNAKLVHDFLEVKTPLSQWIDRIIKRYSFMVDEDFITNMLESNGGRPVTEFIVTMDMAKEMCMVDNSEKGRKARRYFIQVEKQALQQIQIPQNPMEALSLFFDVSKQQEKRLDTLEHKIDNDISLTSAQKHNIKQKVNTLVYQLKDNHNLHNDFIPKCYSRVWKKVKNHFVVSSYMEIPKSKFDELLRVVDNITISDVV